MGGDSIRLLLREAAILFLAATALGLVYNAASPLGIELRARNAQTTTVGSHGRATYSNETLSIAPQSQRSTPPRNSRSRFHWSDSPKSHQRNVTWKTCRPNCGRSCALNCKSRAT